MLTVGQRIRRGVARLHNPSTVNQRIFRAGALVGSFSVVVKLVATLKELAVASYFGRGDVVDAFLVAYILPSFMVTLVSGSMNAALIPTLIRVREQEGEVEAERLLSSAMAWSLSLLAGLTLLVGVIGPFLLSQAGSAFGPAKLAMTRHLFYVMLPAIVLSGFATNCGAVLNSRGRFCLPAVTPVLTPLITLALLVLSHSRGALVLAIGAVAGSALEAAVLAYGLARLGVRLRLRWYGATPAIREVGLQYLPLLLGVFFTTGVTVADQTMAAHWLPRGSVAALSYGNRIVSVVVGLCSVSLSTALIPYFSEMVARRDWAGCQQTLRAYSRLVLAVAAPITLVLMLGSPLIVRLLYQRGAFGAADTAVVARVQAMYALQVPFFAIGLLHVRLLTALKRNDLVMASAGLNLVLDIILNLVCMRFLGVAGIALSTSLFYVGSFFFASYATRRLLHRVRQAPRPVMAEAACD
jgi:putative peptidoglycan lipid II flippase